MATATTTQKEGPVKNRIATQKDHYKNAPCRDSRQDAITKLVEIATDRAAGYATHGRNIERIGFFMVMNLNGADAERAEDLVGGLQSIMRAEDNKHVTAKHINDAVDGMIEIMHSGRAQQPVCEAIAKGLAAMAADPVIAKKTQYGVVDKITQALVPSFPELANQAIEGAIKCSTDDALERSRRMGEAKPTVIAMSRTMGAWLHNMTALPNTNSLESELPRARTLELLGKSEMLELSDDAATRSGLKTVKEHYALSGEEISVSPGRKLMNQALKAVTRKLDLVAEPA